MENLFVFVAAYLTALICLTGVKGGVCPGYNIPVIWPCSEGTITGTKLLVDTSEIPIDKLQCNCKLTTTTNAIQISLIKAPDYRNCGTEIRFSTASSVEFGCFRSGTVVNTEFTKTVDIMVEKDNTISDIRHCFYIDSSTNSIANMSLTCSSHRSTAAPTTNITTPFTSTASTSTSPSPSSTPTVISTSSSATTAIPTTSTATPSQTVSVSTTQTSSAIPKSTSYSESTPFTNPITTDSKTTITSAEKMSDSTQKSSTAESVQTDITSRQPTATMTDSVPVTTDQVSEITTTDTEQDGKTTNSEGETKETSPISITNAVATEIGDSTVSGKTNSDSTVGSEKAPNTQQSTTSYTGTTPNNATLTDGDEGANPERLTVVIVIATIIGIILICVLVGAIYYQKKQKRKVSLNHRSGFTNMASTVDEEKATKVDSKNHIYDNPNLIPYGHIENT
ncbi:hypothetical protein LOTGIDRAFT_167707 [Lottia gigantea]|uniref:ZP domain-containing protein n=1 Tax=Lottia gigantea TaxID=225164 RepID=V3ZN35_LOTGI|nr:hypothetical protein LOTGIDRAFT_167707 [Lottia gigantea]ESO85737.1 hypothetical protein LOTGIDRAFT_167707 [Lottia gigantea]